MIGLDLHPLDTGRDGDLEKDAVVPRLDDLAFQYPIFPGQVLGQLVELGAGQPGPHLSAGSELPDGAG